MDGPLPIPLSEIDAYCRLAGIPSVERLAFVRRIRRIDAAYLDLVRQRDTPAPQIRIDP